MSEVYSGSRPARPGLATILTAGILVVSLGAASLQVFSARALGPPTKIPGTNLIVRPPKGWLQRHDRPNTFVLVLEEDPVGRHERHLMKELRFISGRAPHLLAGRQLLDSEADGVSARVGPLYGVQGMRSVQRQIQRFFGQTDYQKATIVRSACSPRGDFIRVEYDPLAEPTAGDFDLMDDVCEAVQLEEPALSVTPQDAARQAGIELSLDSSWLVAGPDFPEIRGLYVGGFESGRPAWSIGVFRTWLAEGRTPESLLVDFSVMPPLGWDIFPEQTQVESAPVGDTSQAGVQDGKTVSFAEHGRMITGAASVASAWVVAAGPDKAALLLVVATPESAPSAKAAVRQIAGSLRFVDSWPDLAGGARAGSELADSISRRGASRFWPPKPVSIHYAVHPLEQPENEIIVVRRAPADEGTFQGSVVHHYAGREYPYRWEMSEDTRSYRYVDQGVRGGVVMVPVELREARSPATGKVKRVMTAERRGDNSAEYEFVPPDNFFGRPAEDLAEYSVARTPPGTAAIVAASTRFGPGWNSRVLQSLAPDEHARPRVLLIMDYCPRGTLIAYDEDGEASFVRDPGVDIRRATPDPSSRRTENEPAMRASDRED